MAAWRESGDPVAGRALVDAMYPFVAALVRRHVADPGAIEDLAQQTFVRSERHYQFFSLVVSKWQIIKVEIR